KDNETEYLYDYITLDNLEDYEKYLQDNDNDLTNSNNNTEQNTQKYKLFESQLQSFEEFNRKYSLYFPNFTSTLLFLWITEHMIFTAAYEDLRNRLPLLKVWSHTVPISRQHTLSNSASTKPTYSIIPVDYIEYILNNPTIVPNLYFGPGIVCDEKPGNFLHYHQDKAIKFTYIYNVVEVNKRQLLRADPLVPYCGLLGHLCSMNRKACGMNMKELWLVKGQECLIISKNIIQINVWLKDLDRPVEYEYFVTEILYSFN
ncbi:17672_t:CDS:2, partial [Racocetra persica]